MRDLLHKSHARLAASSKLLLHGDIVDGSKGVKNLPHILLLHMQAPQVSTFVLAQKSSIHCQSDSRVTGMTEKRAR